MRFDMRAEPASSTLMWQETGKVLEGTDERIGIDVLVREYSRFVYKVAYGILRNCHDAEDVVQEVFLRVYRSGSKGVRDTHAWLARIAFRLAIDRLRKTQPSELGELQPASSDASAEHVAIQRERVAYLRKIIAALPDELRYPLVLSAIEELNSRQIAEVLGISESAVRGRVFRAREILKEKFAAVMDCKP